MDAETWGPRLDTTDLDGTHVRLEPLRSDHAAGLAEAAAGDRSSYGWTAVPDGRQDAERYVASLLEMSSQDSAAPFVQRASTDGRIIGATRFMEPRWPLGRQNPDEVEIGGTWLSPNVQRTLVNTEAKLLLLTHAFEWWGVQRVALCTDARNTQSRRAIERIGAEFEGILRNHRPSAVAGEDGSLRDSALYAIVFSDWPDVRVRLREMLGEPVDE